MIHQVIHSAGRLLKRILFFAKGKLSPMTAPREVDVNESLHDILKKFDDTKQWNLPVVKDKIYIGFLSKARILSEYRTELMKTI